MEVILKEDDRKKIMQANKEVMDQMKLMEVKIDQYEERKAKERTNYSSFAAEVDGHYPTNQDLNNFYYEDESSRGDHPNNRIAHNTHRAKGSRSQSSWHYNVGAEIIKDLKFSPKQGFINSSREAQAKQSHDMSNNQTQINFNNSNQESMDRKFEILFREITQLKDNRAEMKVINSTLADTRRIVFTLKEAIESKLKDYEQILYSSLDIDMKANADLNLLEDSKYNLKSKYSEVKNNKQELMDGIVRTLGINSKNIGSIESSIAKLEKSLGALESKEYQFEMKIRDKQDKIEEQCTEVSKIMQILDQKLKSIEDKVRIVSEVNDRQNKDTKSKCASLEELMITRLDKAEEEIKNEIGKIEESFSKQIQAFKSQIDDKTLKTIKKELEVARQSLLNEVSTVIWEKKKQDMKADYKLQLDNLESKINSKILSDIDLCRNDINAKIVSIKENILKLETSNPNQGGPAVHHQNKTSFNQMPLNAYSMLLNNVSGSSMIPLGQQINNQQQGTGGKLPASSFLSSKKLAKNEIKDFIMENSDDEDDFKSVRNSKLNETSKSKSLFNRFSNM